jgi:hypothetical protein
MAAICALLPAGVDVNRSSQTGTMDVTAGQGPSWIRRRIARLREEQADQLGISIAGETRLLRDPSSLNGYVFAIAGVRRHSMAASAAITMVTMNSPTTIIRSTEPSC